MALEGTEKTRRMSAKRLAHRVLSRAEMLDVRLVGATVDNKLPAGQKPKQVKMRLDSESVIAQMGDGAKQVHVRVTFRVLAIPESQSEAESVHLDFTFLITYSLTSDDGISEDHLVAFTKWIGFNNVWPYAREFIHNISSRMGIAHLKLPLYKPEKLTDDD